MQPSTSLLVLLSLLPALGLAAPAASGTKASSASSSTSTGKAAAGTFENGVTDTQVAMAVKLWMNDTGKVSKFLDTATSFSGDEFTKQATIALNAEKDELNHKAVLDDAIGTKSQVKSANDTLATMGTFQAVVDALQQMVNEGPDTAQAQVNAINANRCVNVLPNIDAYFAAAGSASVKSVRPTGCLEVAQNSTNQASATDGSTPASTGTSGSKGSKSSASADAASVTAAASAATDSGSTDGSSDSSATAVSSKKSTKTTKTTAATATAKAAKASSASDSASSDSASSDSASSDSASSDSASDDSSDSSSG